MVKGLYIILAVLGINATAMADIPDSTGLPLGIRSYEAVADSSHPDGADLITAVSDSNAKDDTTKTGAEKENYMKITGLRSFSYLSRRKVTGVNPIGFTPYSMRQDLLKMRVDGRLNNSLDIAGDVMQSSTPGEEELLSFLVKGARGEVTLGKYERALEGSEFTSIEKTLSGVKAGGGYKAVDAKAIYASPEGSFILERIPGNGTQGPYQLQNSPMVYGSEKVKLVDGINSASLQKGVDYTVDYTGGTIQLLKRVANSNNYLEVQYEKQSGSGYNQTIYGVQTLTRELPFYNASITYVRLSDRTDGIKSTDSLQIRPTDQSIYGLVQELKFDKALKLNIDAALSVRDTNSLAENEIQKGTAYKTDLQGNWSAVKLSGYYKRTEPNFAKIGRLMLFPDSRNFGGQMGLKPFESANLAMSVDRTSEKQDSLYRKTLDLKGSTEWTPGNDWKLSYEYQAGDVSYGNSYWTRNHKMALSKAYKIFAVNTKTGMETKSDAADSVNGKMSLLNYQLGLNTRNLDKFTAEISYGYEKSIEAAKSYHKNLLSSQFTGNFGRNYVVTSNINYQEDSEQGVSNIYKLSYQVKPWQKVSSDGKYSLETVNTRVDLDAPQGQGAINENGIFKFDLYPIKSITLSCRPEYKLSRIKSTNQKFYELNSQQYAAKFNPGKYLSTDMVYDNRRVYAVSSIRSGAVINSSFLQGNKINSRSRIAPLTGISFAVDLARSFEKNSAVMDTGVVDIRDRQTRTYDWGLTSIVKLLYNTNIEAGYEGKNVKSSATDSLATLVVTHAGKGKIVQELNKYFTVNGSARYSVNRGQDPLVSQTNSNTTVSTFTPSLGFTFKPVPQVFIESSYLYANSTGDATTILETLNLETTINYPFVQFNLGWKFDKRRSPDYITSEVRASLNIQM
ncbi:MAG: hypothetical protein ACYDEQ_06930 [Desulfocucumaceae bacterium]